MSGKEKETSTVELFAILTPTVWNFLQEIWQIWSLLAHVTTEMCFIAFSPLTPTFHLSIFYHIIFVFYISAHIKALIGLLDQMCSMRV